MLVLSRKVNETIIIRTPDGYQIEVMLVQIGRDKVRLGFEADPSVTINRSEVQEFD